MQLPIQSKRPALMSFNFNSSCRLGLFLFVNLLFLQPIFAQRDFSTAQTMLERNKKLFGNASAFQVVSKDTILYNATMGTYTSKLAVPLGDASRWLATAVILKILEEGKVNLDDPVVNYIPEFGKYMKNYITLRHCLNNTTGIEHSKSISKGTGKKYASLEEEVNAIAAREIQQNPGEHFHYGPAGIQIAARVVEVAYKRSFERLVQEKITRPLKMRASKFANDAGGAINPSNGAISSANDMGQFLRMLLQDGMFEGKEILSKESIRLMFQDQLGAAKMGYLPAAAGSFGYGFGVWLEERDNQGIGTLVSCPSFLGNYIWMDKKQNYGVVILTNGKTEQKAELYEQVKASF